MEREDYDIPNMPSQLRDYGLRPPDFDYDGGYSIVTFYGREKSSSIHLIPQEVFSQLTNRQREILNLVWEGEK